MSGRIAERFTALKAEGRGGLVTFITAGDPDPTSSLEIFKRLPGAGADLIELGMPFSDPMADGPAIQASSRRALQAGASMANTLAMVRAFRQDDAQTPVVLMGYYNPVYVYGVERFVHDAAMAGVDGLIVVDLPPEEAKELAVPAAHAGLSLIYLTTPTTDDNRLPKILANAGGFIYYVSVAGVTGVKSAAAADVRKAVERLKRHTNLPIAVGFGIKTPTQAAAVAKVADAAVVGSALVNKIAENLTDGGAPRANLVNAVLELVYDLSGGVKGARG